MSTATLPIGNINQGVGGAGSSGLPGIGPLPPPKFQQRDIVNVSGGAGNYKVTGIDWDVSAQSYRYELDGVFYANEVWLKRCTPGGGVEPCPVLQKKCSCGAHKTYGIEFDGHSAWCDLYVKTT